MSDSGAWIVRDLEWAGSSWLGRDYVLRAGDDELARLSITGVLRRDAVFEAPGIRWRLVAGVWLPPAVRVEEGGRTIASYQGGWWGRGTLVLEDGTRAWNWRHRWWRRWQFEDDGVPVMRFWRRPAWLHVCAGAHVERETLPVPDALMMLAVGFLVMLRSRHGRA